MRGKDGCCNAGTCQKRITPAHAGKSNNDKTLGILYEDHPRSCGEKTKNFSNRFPVSGSPPLMRGKETQEKHSPRHQRITPAHAGKSKPAVNEQLYIKDHPRSCGEKTKNFSNRFPVSGSPPLMRGKETQEKHSPRHQRITPAHAGKSKPAVNEQLYIKDHPRSCGEKVSTLSGKSSNGGSPPLMRGKGNSGK